MKIIVITIGFILLLPLFLFAANQQTMQNVKNVQSQKETAPSEEKIIELRMETKKEIEFQQQMIQTSFSSISNSLTMINVFFSIVALFGIVLAAYITFLTNKMAKSYQNAQDLLKKSEAIKVQVDQLNEMIKNNFSELYKLIKEEETRYIIKRLKKEPKDITNLANALGSRELSKDYYPDLRACYVSFKQGSEDNRYRNPYIILIFQHYPDLAFFDPQLADSLKSSYYLLFTYAFKNDILNATKGLVEGCVDRDFYEEGKVLIPYLDALKQHAQETVALEDIFGIIWEGTISRDNRFGFYQMIPDGDYHRDLKTFYGRRLLEKYGPPGNTESENLILAQARELLASTELNEAHT
jgi:hypothetical protein